MTQKASFLVGRSRLIVLSVACLSLAIAIFLLSQTVRNNYMMAGGVELLVDYVSSNDGKWPENWRDLESFGGNRILLGGSVDDLEKNVTIKFNCNVSDLLKNFRKGKVEILIAPRVGFHTNDSNRSLLQLLELRQNRRNF